MRNIYDNSEFFAAYAEMGRSKDGLWCCWLRLKRFNKQLSVCSTNNFIILPRNVRQKWRIFLFPGAEMLLFLYLFLGGGEISWQAEYRVLP